MISENASGPRDCRKGYPSLIVKIRLGFFWYSRFESRSGLAVAATRAFIRCLIVRCCYGCCRIASDITESLVIRVSSQVRSNPFEGVDLESNARDKKMKPGRLPCACDESRAFETYINKESGVVICGRGRMMPTGVQTMKAQTTLEFNPLTIVQWRTKKDPKKSQKIMV